MNLAELPRLKMIAVTRPGMTDRIAACRSRDIAVANIRNYANHTVPEHVSRWCWRYAGIYWRTGKRLSRAPGSIEQFCLFTNSIASCPFPPWYHWGGRHRTGNGRHCTRLRHALLFAYHPFPRKKGGLTPFDQVLAESDIFRCTVH